MNPFKDRNEARLKCSGDGTTTALGLDFFFILCFALASFLLLKEPISIIAY